MRGAGIAAVLAVFGVPMIVFGSRGYYRHRPSDGKEKKWNVSHLSGLSVAIYSTHGASAGGLMLEGSF